MSKKNTDPRQRSFNDLFKKQEPESSRLEDGAAIIHTRLRHLLNRMIRKSVGGNRDCVAADMSLLLHANITADQINSWTREDKPRHIPAQYMFALEIACGSTALSQFWAELHGGQFIDSQQARMLELGEIYLLKTELAEKERTLKAGLKS